MAYAYTYMGMYVISMGDTSSWHARTKSNWKVHIYRHRRNTRRDMLTLQTHKGEWVVDTAERISTTMGMLISNLLLNKSRLSALITAYLPPVSVSMVKKSVINMRGRWMNVLGIRVVSHHVSFVLIFSRFGRLKLIVTLVR